MMVFFCHLRNTFALSFNGHVLIQLKEITHSYFISHLLHSFLNFAFDGKLAVSIFWFMSAYVISIKLFSSETNKYLFKSFSKRYFRLMIPTLGSILFAYILLISSAMHNIQLAQVLGPSYQNGWLGSFYPFEPHLSDAIRTGLWDTFFDYGWRTTYNASLWSMHPELYGSVFCFFLFGVTGKYRLRHYFYFILICGSFLLKSYWMVSFLLGFSLCDLDYSPANRFRDSLNQLFSNKYLNLLFFISLIIMGGKPNYFGFLDVIISSLLVFLVTRTSILQSILASRFLVWLGKISFSFYLIHLPILCSFTCYLYLHLDMPYPVKAVTLLSSTLSLTLFLAHFFNKYIDRNGIILSNRFAAWLTKQDD